MVTLLVRKTWWEGLVIWRWLKYNWNWTIFFSVLFLSLFNYVFFLLYFSHVFFYIMHLHCLRQFPLFSLCCFENSHIKVLPAARLSAGQKVPKSDPTRDTLEPMFLGLIRLLHRQQCTNTQSLKSTLHHRVPLSAPPGISVVRPLQSRQHQCVTL